MKTSTNIPASMQVELQDWNTSHRVDLEGWVGCEGRFALAVGYASVFCPEFFEFEDYILRGEGPSEGVVRAIRGFESGPCATPRSVEWTLNHLHICDIQHYGCPDIAADRLVAIGTALKKIYEARLAHLFPERPCVVQLYIPDDPQALQDYQLSFWQAKHEEQPTPQRAPG